MFDEIQHLFTSRGMAIIINGLACIVFLGFVAEAILRKKINFGLSVPRIYRAERPRVYWSIILLYGVIAAWTGLSAIIYQ